MEYSTERIGQLISPQRFSAYLKEGDNNPTNALHLYEWSSQAASALFELIGHLEIILRNSIDHALSVSLAENERRIPWFMMKLPGLDARLDGLDYRKIDQDRDQALSSLTMGFWSLLVQNKNFEKDLEEVFGEDCDFATLHRRVHRVHLLRNRLAHHGSMLDVDMTAEVANILDLAEMIDPDAAAWLSGIDRVTELYKRRPTYVPDTVLVPAKDAWPVYQKVGAYVCQPGRAFRPVTRIAFYYDGKIQPEVPAILAHEEFAPWNDAEVERLMSTGDALDERIANTIKYTRKHGWSGDQYQVFVLTRSGEEAGGEPPRHRRLSHAVPHTRTGRGSAFVRKQRYFHFSDLASAGTTEDLPTSYFLSDSLPESPDTSDVVEERLEPDIPSCSETDPPEVQ